ncbi:multicopper oxidase family protein [Micromonospora siamensis]|uniref:Multicopper oxidase with three cupredoxin domains (Includes cell division protein FtsP and spore coat protein CotA) n=1 Tax=Micromonospora siamensis TaxID=299152 RepID=A0A1C5H6K5_9ACTN|nr:multicopper oxidase family protein [Micromonospora siamensis]SCG41648.1 Multicopper oxidase with three cupredoxin domains (includes cell division protein FtsP and spore coat protein CotA) [Micromonospora siamensis]
MTAPIGRRRALTLLGLGAAGLTVGATGWLLADDDSRLRPASGDRPLPEPTALRSRDGRLDVRLVAAAGVRLAGRDTRAWGWNGRSPGPTLRVRPGDLLRVRLENRLPMATSLHTHGLHVSPLGDGDDPFRSVPPGDTADYAFRIPADHPAGTFWYHPHHHGSVADQVFAGLVGALVVEDEPAAAVAERLLVVTDTSLDGSGRVRAPDPMAASTGRLGELVLVNGEHQPVIDVRTGAVERWRIVNACAGRVLRLDLAGPAVDRLAFDGWYLPATAADQPLVLAPGNRADLWLRTGTAGRYPLLSAAGLRANGGMGMGMGMGMGAAGDGPVTLATVAVTGPPTEPPAAPVRPDPAPPLPGPVTRRRRLTLGSAMGPGGMRWTVDGRGFDPDRDDQVVPLGSVEEWTVLNGTGQDHPFHLHTRPFQVMADSTGAPPVAVRQDVVTVPAGGWVRLRIAFTDLPGRSVYHCHTLDHEDGGMMGTVRVVES